MKKINYEYSKDKMLLIYFSGTGNTKLVANRIAKFLNVEIKNIEDDCDFKNLLLEKETILIMYPVYYSTPPIIMRDFLEKYKKNLEMKNIMSIVTQMCFSGDGAYILKDYIPKNADLIYSRHINMPSNISNIPVISFWGNFFSNLKIKHALKKADKISNEIINNNLKTQGNTKFWNKIGLSQRSGGLEKENSKRSNVWIDDSCIACGICEKNCPVNNLVIKDEKVVAQNKCIFCTRCENTCPQKSIRILINKKVKNQYRVPKNF